MWMQYVLRELSRRRRQAAAVSAGLAVAVAVVIVLAAVSAGLGSAQSKALAALYGVGTGVTVTHPAQGGTIAPGPRFSFAPGTGTGSTTTLAQSQLVVARGLTPIPASDLPAVATLPMVSSADAMLMLDNYDFSGLIPGAGGQPPTGDGGAPAPNEGGSGSAFTVDHFSVAGVDASAVHGIVSSLTVTAGRSLSAADAGHQVALVDTMYAQENQITVGAPVNIGGIDIPVVGLVSAADGRPSPAQSYLPLDVAQTLSGQSGKITTMVIATSSAADVAAVTHAVERALPGAHVATQADLASTMTGTLASASSVSSSIGLWLSVIALTAAALLAALLTMVGVTRRSREFGTLKALGWTSRGIVGQVAGESLIQGAVGAVFGVTLAGAAIAVTNSVAPTLTAGSSNTDAAAAIPLVLSLSPTAAVLGIGLAMAAALLAAVAGSFRVASLRPSESLRSDQ